MKNTATPLSRLAMYGIVSAALLHTSIAESSDFTFRGQGAGNAIAGLIGAYTTREEANAKISSMCSSESYNQVNCPDVDNDTVQQTCANLRSEFTSACVSSASSQLPPPQVQSGIPAQLLKNQGYGGYQQPNIPTQPWENQNYGGYQQPNTTTRPWENQNYGGYQQPNTTTQQPWENRNYGGYQQPNTPTQPQENQDNEGSQKSNKSFWSW